MLSILRETRVQVQFLPHIIFRTQYICIRATAGAEVFRRKGVKSTAVFALKKLECLQKTSEKTMVIMICQQLGFGLIDKVVSGNDSSRNDKNKYPKPLPKIRMFIFSTFDYTCNNKEYYNKLLIVEWLAQGTFKFIFPNIDAMKQNVHKSNLHQKQN